MLKAIIFDMDGVIVDSEPVHMRAFEVLLKSLGKKFDKLYYYQFIGSTTDYMWDKVIEDYKLNFSKDMLMDMSNTIVRQLNGKKGYPIMPFVAELIIKLHGAGIKLAVASSSGMERIEATLNDMGVSDCFDTLVSGMDVKNPKPAPDTFTVAAKKLGVEPSECIVIEDSFKGIVAAKNANMTCVMYESDNGLPKPDQKLADFVVQSYEDLDEKFFQMVYAHTHGEA